MPDAGISNLLDDATVFVFFIHQLYEYLDNWWINYSK